VQPSCSAEKAEESAEYADAFGTDGGFKPQITGNAESQDEKSGQRKGKQAQGEEKMGGGGGRPRFRESNSGFG
jgi:hypothetical protein